MEAARDVLWWAALLVCLSPIWGALVWHIYEFDVRPRLIPPEEIERLVADMLTKPDPEEAAFIEEQAAWYRSDTFEQGKWRRVRRMLPKRQTFR